MKPKHIAAGLAMGGMMMMNLWNKGDDYKKRHGCDTCKYRSKNMLYSRCMDCCVRKGSKWVKPAPRPEKVYCECCGSVTE